MAIEDRRFYFHHGIDVQAILRAAVVNNDTQLCTNACDAIVRSSESGQRETISYR